MTENESQVPNGDQGEKIFEMLWDCSYCSTKGLLAKTNRFCPGCGAKQDTNARYFPDESSKVEAVNHIFEGADKVCPACNTASSAKASHCYACGSSLDKASSVRLKDDTNEEKKPVQQPNMEKKGMSKGKIADILLVVGIVVFAVLSQIKKDIEVKVVTQSWTTSIQIEKFEENFKSGKCDSLPAGAFNVVQTSSYQDNCRTEKKDRGDGTFSEKKVCDEVRECDYKIRAWEKRQIETRTGGLQDPITWPVTNVTGGECIGCTREGERKRKYKVGLSANNGKSYECVYLSDEIWKKLNQGSSYKTRVNMLGSVECENLN